MAGKIWDNLEEYFLIVSLSVVGILMFIQVIMRYVFSNSLSWSEELARYMHQWLIWVGASYGVKKSRLIRIEIIKGKVAKRINRIIEIVVILACIIFCVFLLVKGNEMTNKILSFGQVSPALGLPMGFPYMSIPVGSSLMIVRYLEKLYETARDLKTPEAVEEVR